MKEDIGQQQEEDWEKLEHIRKRVIHSIAQNMDLYGITPSIGRLYGTMYFQNKPMTLDEMRDSLGMSKTSMSTGVRSLLEINMVQKAWQKGVRKDLYNVEEDWYKTFVDLFATKWKRGIELNENEVKRSKEELEHLFAETVHLEIKEVIAQDIAKLEHAIDYYDWLTRLVKAFENGDIFDYIPKKDSK